MKEPKILEGTYGLYQVSGKSIQTKGRVRTYVRTNQDLKG